MQRVATCKDQCVCDVEEEYLNYESEGATTVTSDALRFFTLLDTANALEIYSFRFNT